MRYLVLILLVLTACETEADRRAERARIQQQRNYADHQACIEYGLEAGTPEYADCRLRLTEMRRMDAASRRAAIMQWYGMQQRQQPKPTPTYKPPIQTYCYDAGGNAISCTTY